MFYDTLHGFIEGGGGAANLEAKLAQHLAGIAHKPLFQVFLDVCKAYYLIDRRRCLEILRGNGMGLKLSRRLNNYWERKRISPKSGKCLGTSFGIERRLEEGDSAYPIIFNIVVDTVVWAVLDVVCSP